MLDMVKVFEKETKEKIEQERQRVGNRITDRVSCYFL